MERSNGYWPGTGESHDDRDICVVHVCLDDALIADWLEGWVDCSLDPASICLIVDHLIGVWLLISIDQYVLVDFCPDQLFGSTTDGWIDG